MKRYKVHESMRQSITAIRDRLQQIVDIDEEYGTLNADERSQYRDMLDEADTLAIRAISSETDGRTIAAISRFIKNNTYLTERSVWAFA